MNTLQRICEEKKIHIEKQKSHISLDEIKVAMQDSPKPLGFVNALAKQNGPSVITEVKKASPSKGVIRSDFDAKTIASTYERNGSNCISVLTDEPYFQGKDSYLSEVKSTVSIPVLRKDFMIDPYQIYESRALGADCILLIMAALRDDDAKEMYDISVDLGMDVLVEVHDKEELDRALLLKPMMLGVNNRNLKTLKVDIQTSYDLIRYIPDDCLKVSESGIATNSQVLALHDVGYKSFLVGESLMREDDIASALHALMGR